MIGADGAHSIVRQLLNIPLLGENNMQTMLNVHFTCPGLGKLLLDNNKSAMLYFVYNEVHIYKYILYMYAYYLTII